MNKSPNTSNLNNSNTEELIKIKQERKKVENDAKLLENRINLLQIEEKKALKKIEETKKKAEKLKQIKLRNEFNEKQKLEVQKFFIFSF